MSRRLSEELVEQLRNVFVQNCRIREVILYGSRAKGTARPGSDIDLTLVGDELTLDDLLAVSGDLDDLMTPYRFDLSLKKHIDNSSLLEHIERVGITLYSSDSSPLEKQS